MYVEMSVKYPICRLQDKEYESLGTCAKGMHFNKKPLQGLLNTRQSVMFTGKK